MPNLTTEDGRTIHYRVIGNGGHDVVLVHGWMVSGAVWDNLLGRLEGTDWRMIVPDQRGTGPSEEADSYALQDYVDDLAAVVDDAGADSFSLVGHSMGGTIAQIFAATYPERVEKLALLCPVPASGVELPEEAHNLFINSGGNRDSQEAILEMACNDIDEGDKQRLLADAGKIPADCIRQSYQAWTGGGFADKLGDISAQTLVVGSDDMFLPPEFLEQAVVDPIPGATFTHIGGAGHYVQVERTEETAETLKSFLED